MNPVEANGPTPASKTERTKAKILEAALELFAERGFHGASVRDIAARADLAHGLLKYHFENKDLLWKAAVEFLFERQAKELAPPPGYEDLSPDQRVRNWLRRYVRYCARRPEHARIIIQESLHDTERLRWLVDNYVSQIHAEMRPLAKQWMKEGVYPFVPEYAIIYIIMAAAQSPFLLAPEVKLTSGVDMSNETQIDAYADALIEFLFDHKSSG